MFRPLYDRVMRLAESRHAPAGLFAVSFAESSFFPVPPDTMLAPMIIARPDRAYAYATLCTLASVLGGVLGYAIGYFLEPVGQQLLAFLGHADGQAKFEHWFGEYGLWVILAKGVTIIPYKIVTIASGLARFDFLTFLWASVLTRGMRFYITAAMLKRFGPAVRVEVEKRLTLYATLGIAALVATMVIVNVVL
ncbi:MAG TPA: YqaA family protein [Phenylobacterium sp.]